MTFPRVSSLKTAVDFRNRLAALGIDMPFDDEVSTSVEAPLAQPYTLRKWGHFAFSESSSSNHGK